MKEILENGNFVINEEDGTSKKYSTLFTFYNKIYGKNYVVYCDYLEEEALEGEVDVYASIYNLADSEFKLIEIVDENELNMVQKQISLVMNASVKDVSIDSIGVDLDE